MDVVSQQRDELVRRPRLRPRCQCPWPGTSGFPISAQIRSKLLTPIFTSNDPETVSPGLGERILIEGAPVRAARVAGGLGLVGAYWISTELALCSTSAWSFRDDS